MTRSQLRAALEQQQEGNLVAAEAGYRQFLTQYPDHLDGLNLLGALLYQQGRYDESLQCFERVQALQPDSADALNSVGIVLRAQGNIPAAIACYRKALNCHSAHPEIYSNLGNALREAGEPVAAIVAYQQALALKPDHAEGHNNLGVMLKDLNRLEEAIHHYEQALNLKPDYAEAHHNLAVAYYQQNRLVEAASHYRRAIALKPGYAEAYHGLGGVWQRQRQFTEAIRWYQQAIALKPDFAEARYGLANALHQQGQLDTAIKEYRQVLEYLPDYPEVHNNLGNALQTQGNYEAAIAHYQKALALRPTMVEALGNLGAALRDQGNYEAAIAQFKQALAQQPDSAEIHNHLGSTYAAQGDLTAAIAAYRHSLRLNPDVAEVHSNLGNMLQSLGDFEAAFRHFDRAIALQPDYAGAYNNLGIALRNSGRVSEAFAAYAKALECDPNCVEARWNCALNYLLEGDLEKGFAEYEWRLQWQKFRQLHPPRPYPQPYWDGSPIASKTLLIYCEQGLGDTIQFIRYVPILAAQGVRVLVECPTALLQLLQGVAGITQLIAQGDPLPDFDYHLSLMSLPHRLGTTATTIPAEIPYIQITHARELPPPLQQGSALQKIGLVWSGNPANAYNRQRALPLERLLTLTTLAGVQFYSLQKEVTPPEEATLAAHPEIIDLRPAMVDFVDTAALIQNLDLVISVDTAVAHLAGALGKPVWLLLPFAPDWRWQRDRTDSPWYPTLHIFRQPTLQDWDSVLSAVRAALQSILAGEGTAMTSPQPQSLQLPSTHLLKTQALTLNIGPEAAPGDVAPATKTLPSARLEDSPSFPAGHPQLLQAPAPKRKPRNTSAPLPPELYTAVRHYNAGEYAQAEQLCRQLIDQQETAEAWHLLGLMAHQQRQFEVAIAHYNRVIALNPDHAETYNNLAVAYQQQGQLNQAIAYYEQALALDPGYADAHNNFANALREQNQLEKAIHHYQQALALKPDYADAYNNLGLAYYAQERYTQAAAAYRQAIALRPGYHQAHNHLGNALKELGAWEQAIGCYEQAIALKPDYAKAFNNLGNVYRDQGDLPKALAQYERAIQLEPNFAEAHWNKALTHLLQGDLQQGFAEYEWRWQVKLANFRPMRQFGRPLWDGRPFPGKTLFLHAEQGMGDILQFFRYVAIAAELGGHIVLECHAPLTQLLQAQPHVLRVVPYGSMPPQFDLQAPLMSLPHILGTTLATVPAQVPYLQVPPCEQRLPIVTPTEGPPPRKVGLVWTGNPQNPYNKLRQIPLEQLLPLASLPSVQLYSLQKEMPPEDAALLAAHPEMIDLREQMTDFVDTAALIQELDLVISVDTAVTHLAGALAKPVWLLLPYTPDWRWLLHRSDSPWYPTLRIFRQTSAATWDTVIVEVQAALRDDQTLPLPPSPIAPPAPSSQSGQGFAKQPSVSPARRPPVALSVTHLHSLLNQAMQYIQQRQFAEAERLCRQVLSSRPEDAMAMHILGVVLCQTHQLEEAIALFRQVLAQQPDHAEAWSNLAGALQGQGKTQEAIAAYERALALQPNFAEAHQNLAIVLREQGQLEPALTHARRAVALQPDSAEACYNMGFLLRQTGDLEGAVGQYRRAIALKPDFVAAHKNLGHALLLQGNFREGFAENEWRWQQEYWTRRPFSQPQWQGEDLTGQTILLHAEQGFGDTIQFIRFAELVKARGAKVLVECQPSLLRLLETVRGIDQLIAQGSPLPPFDTHLPLLSLPHVLQTTLETLPAVVPYLGRGLQLSPPPETIAGDLLKVGIVWAGNPNHRNDRWRSCQLEDFLPLVVIPHVQFFSLQKGAAEQELRQHPDLPVVDWGQSLEDFADTAAAIQALDLVITVDTAVAHLAGALGKPVWVLLHYAPDWRWMLEREDSPWYPTMRLFRQTSWDDWTGVFARVKAALTALAVEKVILATRGEADGHAGFATAQAEPVVILENGVDGRVSLAYPEMSLQPLKRQTQTASLSPPTALRPCLLTWAPELESDAGIWGLQWLLQVQRSQGYRPFLLQAASPQLPTLYQQRLGQVQTLAGDRPRGETIFPLEWLEHSRGLVIQHLGDRPFASEQALICVGVVADLADLSLAAMTEKHWDYRVVPSAWAAQQLQNDGKENVRVVPWGVDPSVFHPAPKAKIWGDRFVVVSAGQVNSANAQDLVLAAFAAFYRHHPEALLVTSWDRGLPTDLPAEAFCHLGPLPYLEQAQLIREAGVAVFPNRCSVSNRWAIASLACGVPTILSANTGHLDLTQQNLGYPLLAQEEVTDREAKVERVGWGESSVEEILENLERIYRNREEAAQRGAIAADFLSDRTWATQMETLLQHLSWQ